MWGSPAHFLSFDVKKKLAILSVRGADLKLVDASWHCLDDIQNMRGEATKVDR